MAIEYRYADDQTIGGAAVMWPLTARAEQAAMPVVGFLRSTSLVPFETLATALGQGLKEAGLVEGENVAIEYRYADDQTIGYFK